MPKRRLLLFVLVTTTLLAATVPDYRTLHYQALVADGHSDTLGDVLNGRDLGTRSKEGHIDIPKMREGGLDLPFFACWVDPKYISTGPDDPDSSAWRVRQMIGALRDQIKKHPKELALATSADEARAIVRAGKIACALGVEGGHAIENNLAVLGEFYRRGVRYMTLTWNNSTDWATSAADESSGRKLPFTGLTDFGREVVRQMNRLGLMVDVSHVGEKTFWDVMAVTTKPVIASHSSVYALCPHFRNLKDDQIRALAKSGGVVLINFYSGYLDSTFERRQAELQEKYRVPLDSLRRLYGGDWDHYLQARRALFSKEPPGPEVTADEIVDHIEYVIRLVGPDYVGLGSDFDGVTALPIGMEDCSRLPLITKLLLERGHSPEVVRKVLGENFLRVWKEVSR